MICTAQELLDKMPTKLYEDEQDGWRNYKMSFGDFFELSDDFTHFDDFQSIRDINRRTSELKQSAVYTELTHRIRKLQLIAKSTPPEALSQIREKIKELRQAQTRLAEAYQKESCEAICGHDDLPHFIQYKSTLVLNSFQNIAKLVPALSGLSCDWLRTTPLFTKNIAALPTSNLAIEGGPCLFGTDEVQVTLIRNAGEHDTFDCNTYKSETVALNLFDYLDRYAQEITSVSYVNLKEGISAQEFEYFDLMFAVADALQIPLLISIPDMSYLKYFKRAMRNLYAQNEPLYQTCYRQYEKILIEISDLYLSYIDARKKQYDLPKVAILHMRDAELLDVFYHKREAFLSKRNVTKNESKLDSISDYITMPAMPYYLWGTTNVIEINSTDETDAIRKCMKNHKNVIKFFPIMIPEKVSRDGKTTIFEAKRSLKDYLR